MLGTSGLLYCSGHKDTEEHHRPLSPTCSGSAGTCLSQWEGVMGDPPTLPKDTFPVPSEHTWLGVAQALFPYRLLCAVSLLAVGLLWSGLYIQECSQIAEGTGIFFELISDPRTLRITHLGSRIGRALVENLNPVRTHPCLGRFGYVQIIPTEGSHLSMDSQWETQKMKSHQCPKGVSYSPQVQLRLHIRVGSR